MKHNETTEQNRKEQNRTTTTVKNPNWLEANQLAIYKCSWEVEPGITRVKLNECSEHVLNLGSPHIITVYLQFFVFVILFQVMTVSIDDVYENERFWMDSAYMSFSFFRYDIDKPTPKLSHHVSTLIYFTKSLFK